MALPPGPSTPGALTFLRWMASPTETLARTFREHGDLYSTKVAVYGVEVVVSSPDLIRQVFTGDPEVFHGGDPNQMLGPVVGDRSVLLLDGAAHHRERKLLMPPFHGDRLAVYADVMRELTEAAVQALPVGVEAPLLPCFHHLTFEVILQTVFGVREGAEIDLLRERLGAMMKKASSPLSMLWLVPALQYDLGPFTGWASLKRCIAGADEAIYAVIAAARAAAAAAAGPQRTDVLSLLLAARDDEGQPMSDKELRDELLTMLLAGHETTAIALAWAVDAIVRRPEVLEKILAEIDAAPGGAVHRAPLPYLDATIKEVLRLRPLTSFITRRTTAPITLREYEIPAGTYLVMCVSNAQRHPDFWEDPDEFRPERFLGKKPDPYAWLPFGGGARRCIGMAFALFEMRVVLATLLGQVRLSTKRPPAGVTLRSFLLTPKGGTRVVVEGPRRAGARDRTGVTQAA
jgi:cytochrome P450